MSLPQHLVQEHEDVHDHQNALNGYGKQTVHKGKKKKIGEQMLNSFRCRAKNRKGKGRRCKNMGRSTFPYCFVHSSYKIGVRHNNDLNSLIACREFETGEVVCTVKSIQTGEVKEKSVLFINDDENDSKTSVCYSKSNESTIGRYASQVHDIGEANTEYQVFEVEYHDKESNDIVNDSMISLVCTKHINEGEQIKVFIP